MWDGCVAIWLSAGNGCNYNHFPSSQQPRSNHAPTTTSNHDTTIFRVESKSDSDSTIPHPIFSNHNSTTRKRIREAVAECEAYARPARTTRSLRAPRRHDFDARAFTRALYAVVKITPGPQTCSRATVGSPALSIRSTASRILLRVVELWLENRECGVVVSKSFLDSTRRMVESWLERGCWMFWKWLWSSWFVVE